jgi:hypothetical protein
MWGQDLRLRDERPLKRKHAAQLGQRQGGAGNAEALQQFTA